MSKKTETPKEFEARVRAFFLKNGWKIKELSDECIAGRIANGETDTSKITEAHMKAKAPMILKVLPDQFSPEKIPQPDYRKGVAADQLDKINLATALAAKVRAQKTPLSAWEKNWIRKHGPSAALDIINARDVPFVDESNDDE